MQSLVKFLLRVRPIPIIGISSGLGVYLAATLSTSTRTPSMVFNSSSSCTNPNTYRAEPYTPRHTSWPYTPADFTRQDSSPDTSFYASPRFVTHIDDAAIASLRGYYDSVLPRKGRILDFCSSWVSHYPPSIEQAAQNGELKITGMGMNKAELDANALLNNGRVLVDLNVDHNIAASLPQQDNSPKLDASTCVVSIDYLTSPVAVLTSLRAVTKQGGTVHLVISNRCFPTKAMSRWLRVDEDERLQMVGDFLHFAGWKGIEIVEVRDRKSVV